MEKYVHQENLALFKKRLAQPCSCRIGRDAVAVCQAVARIRDGDQARAQPGGAPGILLRREQLQEAAADAAGRAGDRDVDVPERPARACRHRDHLPFNVAI